MGIYGKWVAVEMASYPIKMPGYLTWLNSWGRSRVLNHAKAATDYEMAKGSLP
jgi:hypothetical protein